MRASLDGGSDPGAGGDGRGGLDRLQGPVPRHRRRRPSRRDALSPGCRGSARGLARGSGSHRRDEGRAGAASRPRHVGRDHPLGRGHRGARLAAAHRERQAVSVRIRGEALRRLRLLRGSRNRRLRRRPVGAPGRSGPHPAPGGAEPSLDAERRRAARIQPRSTERASERVRSRSRLARPAFSPCRARIAPYAASTRSPVPGSKK